MKLTIKSTGSESPEWPEIEYTLIVETKMHKTTISYWGNDEEFKEFARELSKFPFESKKEIVYHSGHWPNSAYKLTLTIHLVDSAGRTELQIQTYDADSEAKFSGSIEVNDLAELAHRLEKADFTVPCKLEWKSDAK